MKKGIDISEHNASIDFAKVKNDGIEFVIIRIGWIGNKNNHTLDKKFKEYYSLARQVGLKIGFYVYSYVENETAMLSAINWVRTQISGKIREYPIFLDVENAQISNLSKDMQTKLCKYFCKNFNNSGVYASLDWFKNKLNVAELTNYKIWLAQWTNSPNHSADFKVDLWQYTSNGSVNGINGRVDMNYCMLCETSEEEITGKKPDLQYQAHLENIGWQEVKNAGEIAGTEGEARKLEAVKFFANNGLEITYRVHIADLGWQDWKNNGEIAGTTGKNKAIEKIEIKANKILKAEEHVQDVGWLPKSQGTNIEIGTVGKALRLEAFKINVIG